MESFSPQFHTTLAVLFPTIIVFYYLSRKISTKNLAPEAGGAWPIIGHLHLVGRSKLTHIVYGSMADKYGPIFTVRLGIHRYLVVSSWEMMKELFTVNDVFVSGRPKSIATDHLSFDYAMFGFLPFTSLWVELRKVTSAHLLSGTRLEQLKHVRASETEISMKQLYRLWSEKKDASGRVLVADAMKWFGELNLNVILRMLAGKRYSGDDEEARRVRRMTKEFFRLMGVVVVADSFPFLRWLDLGGYEKDMKETAREMDTIVSGWLEEHKSTRNVSTHQEDFMDFLLSAVHNLDFCGFDADTIIKATCMIILSGGADTTAVTQTWSLTMLLNNREVLKKAQEELDNVVGKGQKVQESDLHNLVYLDAIIKETLRLYTPGQLSGPREFTENCTVGGYYVPKGTRLVVNLWKLHRDPRIWSNPNEFRPERFLEKNKEVDARGRHFEYLPFGGGRRMCPGVTFAFQMLHLSLATLLHGFDISAPSDAIIDMDVCVGLTSAKAIPLEVLITPRLSPSLYE